MDPCGISYGSCDYGGMLQEIQECGSLSMSTSDDEEGGRGRCPDFRQSWRRKSSKRILLLANNNNNNNNNNNQRPQRKSAKEHWAMLREYVQSGAFFLDRDYDERTSSVFSSQDMRRPSMYHQRHASLARRFQAKIRGGVEWTCGQCICAIGLYLGTAILCFNFLIPETRHEWTIIDSMYFAVATFTTIGFGDLTPPDTHLARFLTCIFALSGVASLGLAVGVLGHHLVELETKAMHYCERDVMTLFASVHIEDDTPPNTQQEQFKAKPANPHWKRLWNRMGCRWLSRQYQTVAGFLHPTPYNSFANAPCKTEACKRRKAKYEKHFNQQHASQRVPHHINVKFSVFLALILALSYWIGHDAGWDFWQTLYFAITTSCTIGYGDKVPTSQIGRLCVVAFIPFAVGAMGYFLQQLAEMIVQTKHQRHMGVLFGTNMDATNCRQQQRELTVMDLEAMDSDGDGNVDWCEFLEFMLVAMKKVDEDLLWELRYQFDSLDVDDTGVLSKQNLICLARRKLQQSTHKLHLQQYKQYLLKKTNSSSLRQEDKKDSAGEAFVNMSKKKKNSMYMSETSRSVTFAEFPSRYPTAESLR
ncbi:Two pore potassium channel [Seminavis robusta]|uniref:Two pore potassium channel n=1 Tax=Seminavis robusta TaxID=568900 RepID=A0A9N8HFP2_9STRA|nr:Two pore potassium channel [Seminavis robusta]|eukprot:Sro465_g148590.1 Two pore potassium channel (588) ;mRNA; r:26416-28388